MQPGFEGYQMNNRINRVAHQRRVRSVFDGFRWDGEILISTGTCTMDPLTRFAVNQLQKLKIRISPQFIIRLNLNLDLTMLSIVS